MLENPQIGMRVIYAKIANSFGYPSLIGKTGRITAIYGGCPPPIMVLFDNHDDRTPYTCFPSELQVIDISIEEIEHIKRQQFAMKHL